MPESIPQLTRLLSVTDKEGSQVAVRPAGVGCINTIFLQIRRSANGEFPLRGARLTGRAERSDDQPLSFSASSIPHTATSALAAESASLQGRSSLCTPRVDAAVTTEPQHRMNARPFTLWP